MSDYTRPERACERLNGSRVMAIVNRCGGCGVCIHRDREKDAWDRGFCKTDNRTFPTCLREGDPYFEPDWDKIKEAA